jgi:hypothetical protein
MKIVTYLFAALLCAALGAAALFYFFTFQPMSAEYALLKAVKPELDKAKTELKKYKEKEAKNAGEVAWIAPVLETFTNGLNDEIMAGKAEVVSAGNAIVVNIVEDVLYTPGSKTFAKNNQTLLKLATLLKKEGLKEKDIFIGNATEAVAAHGKGKKRVPPKDALTLASERSEELVKYLEKYGVPPESLVAIAYSTKLPDRGFKIKNRKTVIIISTLPAAIARDAATAKPEAAPAPPQARPAPAAQGTVPQTAPKAIPIKPGQPKTDERDR